MSDKRGIQKIALAIAIFYFMAGPVRAEQFTLVGKVIDLESGSPIAGASVRSSAALRGTYTSSQGIFRLPLTRSSSDYIKISSLGYETVRLEVEKLSDSIVVKMKPVSIKTGEVEVNAYLSPEQIVARAIKQKSANVMKIKTFSGLLYSKSVIMFDGSGLNSLGIGGKSFSISSSVEDEPPTEAFKQFVLETFSRQQRDFERGVVHTTILHRRQTANIEPSNNLLTLGNFESFYNDRIRIVDAELPSPLANDAFSFYNFKLSSRSMLDDRYVYIIDVEPKKTNYPAFVGTIAIIEGSYNLIELNLRPSETTAPMFVDSVSYEQKFEEIARDVWYPTFLEVNAKGSVKLIAGMLDIEAKIKATSIFSEIEINKPLPDSVYDADIPRVTISGQADSLSGQFWSENSLREITSDELAIYERIDSLMIGRRAIGSSRNASKDQGTGFSFSPAPYFDFNRVGSASLGLANDVNIFDFISESRLYYSFGTRRFHGSAALEHNLLFYEDFALAAEVSAFSELLAFGGENQYSRIMNSVNSALFHHDYFDYFLAEGAGASLISDFRMFTLEFSIEERNESSLKKSTNRSLFSNIKWRKNPEAETGRYRLGKASLEYGDINELQNVSRFESEFYAEATLGQKIGGRQFQMIDFSGEVAIPTFETGYKPMSLALGLRAGVASTTTPVQYQFRMPTNKLFMSLSDFFVTAPQGVFGGTKYFEGHLQFNFTDLWQRALGLPLWRGRGLELLGGAAVGFYQNETDSFYKDNKDEPYAEAGFGLGRIPTFVSDLFFINVNFRWGVSKLSRGKFGADVSVFTPF
ncbi:MAG: DUF5686 family protein [Chloroflexota bacterium]